MVSLAAAQGIVRLPFLARRQVSQQWWRYLRPEAASVVYGLSLGMGLLTYMSPFLLVVVAACVFAHSVVVGAVMMGVYGLSRALPIVILGLLPQRGVFESHDSMTCAVDSCQTSAHTAALAAGAAATGLIFLSFLR